MEAHPGPTYPQAHPSPPDPRTLAQEGPGGSAHPHQGTPSKLDVPLTQGMGSQERLDFIQLFPISLCELEHLCLFSWKVKIMPHTAQN